MPVVLLQAFQRSADGSNPVKVVSRWPYQAAGPADAKAFLDAYADKGRIGVAYGDMDRISCSRMRRA